VDDGEGGAAADWEGAAGLAPPPDGLAAGLLPPELTEGVPGAEVQATARERSMIRLITSAMVLLLMIIFHFLLSK